MAELVELLFGPLLKVFEDPLYWVLGAVIGVQVALVGTAVIGIGVYAWYRKSQEEADEAMRAEWEPALLEALDSPLGVAPLALRLKGIDPNRLTNFLLPYLGATTGSYHDRIVELYRTLGLHDRDVKLTRSWSWFTRMIAVRRLKFTATAADRQALVDRRNDRLLIRVTAARILAEVGTGEDIAELLKTLQLPGELMDRPFAVLFARMDPARLAVLLDHLDDFANERIRRALLVASARNQAPNVETVARRMALDPDMEVRCGACVAGAYIAGNGIVQTLIDLLEDPAWPVRARAAHSLGHRREPSALASLARRLADEAFWVRQNAAHALTRLGPPGVAALEEAAKNHRDRFARDAAREELQARQMLTSFSFAGAGRT